MAIGEHNRAFLELLVGEIKAGHCAICKVEVTPDTFRDALSVREYQISQMCQGCQDSVFGGEEE